MFKNQTEESENDKKKNVRIKKVKSEELLNSLWLLKLM